MGTRKTYISTTFAYRTEGVDGWLIEQWPMPFEEVQVELRQRESSLLEERQIAHAPSSSLDDQGNPIWNDSLLPMIAFMHGWSFDVESETWRAPGEPLSEPEEEAPQATAFQVVGEKPVAGWWYVTIKLNDQGHLIHCSNVFDPLVELVEWLESIATGNSAGILIDEEGEQSNLTVHVRSQKKVRFTCHHYSDELKITIDGIVDRLSLVAAFYRAIQYLIEDQSLFHREWILNPGGEPIEYSSLRSSVVEEFINEV